MNRRVFLKSAIVATVPGAPVIAASYGLYEAGSVKIERLSIAMPRLPASFDGMRIVYLTDIHHGPFVSQDFVATIVRTTLALVPDLVLLGGDYSSRDQRFIGPCFEVLAGLRAPLGVFGVRGNHEYMHGLRQSIAGFYDSGIHELNNSGTWLTRGTSRIRLAGVDDLWYGKPDLDSALGDAKKEDACLLLSHNPDFAETLRDERVGLVLSGHTHGGQLCVPGYGAPVVPSRYGQKYLKGLVSAPTTQVYISRGLGTVAQPLRYNSPPELTVITLKAG